MTVRRAILRSSGVFAVLLLLTNISFPASARSRAGERTATSTLPYEVRWTKDGSIGRIATGDNSHGAFARAKCTADVCGGSGSLDHIDGASSRSEGYASRRGRAAALPPYRSSRVHDDRANSGASRAIASANGKKWKRARLERSRKRANIPKAARTWSGASARGRRRRSYAVEYATRRNASDHYAERRAVMERYYARQREINARYANRTNDTSRHDHSTTPSIVATVPYAPARSYSDNDSTFHRTRSPYDSTHRQHATWHDDTSTRTSRDRHSHSNLPPDANSTLTKAWDYRPTPTPCGNLSLSGTLSAKTRAAERAKNHTWQTGWSSSPSAPIAHEDSGKERETWGECEGKIVYQHNLLLGLKGPSTLETVFEVMIDGPICITCVQAIRYNATRAVVSLDSGGRGHEFVKLKLKGYENEGFSYIIKIWAVGRDGEDCDYID